MSKIKSAEKRDRQSEARRLRNRACKSGVATARKNVLAAVEAGDKEQAGELYSIYTSKLDKAAKKGTIPKNNASRKKSRMAQHVQKMA